MIYQYCMYDTDETELNTPGYSSSIVIVCHRHRVNQSLQSSRVSLNTLSSEGERCPANTELEGEARLCSGVSINDVLSWSCVRVRVGVL